MTRDAFTTEFNRAMRLVIQKHDRLNAAHDNLREMGSRPVLEDAYAEAQNNLDAAIDQLADHVYDALDGSRQVSEAAD